ncbi:conserved exported hypothetical protein [uncultured Paludibacter sp.]|uniref:Uncharacterized protein n=1 Tax=uncultured Paludibacter sp. TaxID=497635 RepID=A0A653A5Z1_9BACT|nr:conserved exported hypothetical protein [uncultured Paludibacter sp.]
MRKISIILSFFLLIIVFYACSNTKTYSELQDEEQALIANYIQRNNITVVTTLPEPDKWNENQYYKSSSGLYFHLVNPGEYTTTDTVKLKSTIAFRYRLYTLNNPSDTVDNNWSTIDYPAPNIIVYGYTSSTAGLQEAIKYMKYQNSEAKVIVPHNLNSSTYLQSVTPMAYDLKIKIVP